MTQLKHAIMIIDDLLCLYEFWPNGTITEDNSITRDAVAFVAEVLNQDKQVPVSMCLARFLREKNVNQKPTS